MSVHSQSTAPYSEAATPEFPRHVVTAVLVSHDGARWLPDALAGLLGQERPVQSAYAADTGSADDSARLVTEALGDERVLHLARRTGFGAAVDEAVRTAPVLGPEELPYLKRPSGWDPVSRSWRDDTYDLPELPHGEPVQWLWLLHDDCAPAPDALAELLRVADSDAYAAIVGPKLRGWYDRKQLLEVGVSIARSGRRWTGLDRREQDQGQHDQVRPVLSVSSAGDADPPRRVGGARRLRPAAAADARRRRPVLARARRRALRPRRPRSRRTARRGRRPRAPHRRLRGPLRRRPAPGGQGGRRLHDARQLAPRRTALRLPAHRRRHRAAHPRLSARQGTRPGRRRDHGSVRDAAAARPDPRRTAQTRQERGGGERAAAALPAARRHRPRHRRAGRPCGLGAGTEDTGGSRHGAVESGPGGDDADFLEIEQFARLKKIARKPAPVLFALLLLISLAACRELLGGGALSGGALLPAPSGVGDLWGRYADAWHPVGTGGTQTAPPYLAAIAALSALCFGSTGFALTLLLVCSVPLAGLTAYFASRPLVESRLLRAWAAVAYALLPAATGALATGRLGTAVLAVLLPLIARAGITAAGFRGEGRGSWRATWTYALLLTVAMAFTPVVWPLAVLLGAVVLVLRRDDITAHGLRFLAAVGTPS